MSPRDLPIPTRMQPADRWVGEGESRENVAGWPPEAVSIRALDVSLRTHETVRLFKAGIHLELDLIKGALGIAPKPPVVPGSYRDPDASSHDWSVDLAEADRILREKVRDKRDPMNSDRARAIAREVVEAVAKDRDAGMWRKVRAWPGRLAWEAAKVLLTLIVGGAAVELWHWVHH